jgi:hypothetical protein
MDLRQEEQDMLELARDTRPAFDLHHLQPCHAGNLQSDLTTQPHLPQAHVKETEEGDRATSACDKRDPGKQS